MVHHRNIRGMTVDLQDNWQSGVENNILWMISTELSKEGLGMGGGVEARFVTMSQPKSFDILCRQSEHALSQNVTILYNCFDKVCFCFFPLCHTPLYDIPCSNVHYSVVLQNVIKF